MLYHMQFPTVDAVTVNINWNIRVTSQTTILYHLSVKFHDGKKSCEFG